MLLFRLLLLHALFNIFPTDYKLNAIFERIDAELRHYFLQLLLLFLDAVAEFSCKGVSLLSRLAELRDDFICLLGLRSEILYVEDEANGGSLL